MNVSWGGLLFLLLAAAFVLGTVGFERWRRREYWKQRDRSGRWP